MNTLRSEVDGLRKIIETSMTSTINIQPVEDAHDTTLTKAALDELDKKIEQTKTELKALIKSERASLESALQLRIEGLVLKSVKDRVELATETIKVQCQNYVQLLIEDIKEAPPALPPSSSQPLPSPPAASATVDVEPTLPSSIDIEALTKELLTETSTTDPASSGSNEFAFSTRKKVLRKK